MNNTAAKLERQAATIEAQQLTIARQDRQISTLQAKATKQRTEIARLTQKLENAAAHISRLERESALSAAGSAHKTPTRENKGQGSREGELASDGAYGGGNDKRS